MSASGIRNALPATLAASAALELQKSVASMSARVAAAARGGIGDGPADQVFRLLDIVASSKADLLPAGGRVGGHVELAALVPAREPAEFGGGTYIRAAGEKRVEGDVAVVERLVAGLQPVLFKDLELGRDHEWDEKGVDSRRGCHFFERRAVARGHPQP